MLFQMFMRKALKRLIVGRKPQLGVGSRSARCCTKMEHSARASAGTLQLARSTSLPLRNYSCLQCALQRSHTMTLVFQQGTEVSYHSWVGNGVSLSKADFVAEAKPETYGY